MTTELQAILAGYQQAMLDLDADALADLYADTAVHEFPFLFPGMPDRLEGSEEIRTAYTAAWSSSPARPERVTVESVYETASRDTVVVEQVVSGTIVGSDERRFALPGLLIITVHGGRIVHVRDYMDGLAVAQAAGRLSQVAAALASSS